MTVYLDIIIIENTLMNYIILLATGVICKEKIKHLRFIIASIIGSIYAVAYYITKLSIYISIISKIILSIVIIYIAFKPSKAKRFFKYTVIFYLTSFAFGGCAFAVLYYLDSKRVTILNEKFIGIYPIKATIIGGIIGFILINISLRIIKSKLDINDMFCTVKILNDNNKRVIKAMIDTGNFLKDPITNTPVIIIEKESLINILPNEILDNVKDIIEGKYSIQNIEYLSRVRILPFSSLGKKKGILLGIKTDRVEVTYNGENLIKDNIIIGICDSKLTNSNKYNCLLGLNFFREEEENYEYF